MGKLLLNGLMLLFFMAWVFVGMSIMLWPFFMSSIGYYNIPMVIVAVIFIVTMPLCEKVITERCEP